MEVVIPVSSANHLARKIEDYGFEVVYPEIKTFPDGETYTRVGGDLKDNDVYVLCSCQNNSDRIVSEIDSITGGLKYSGAKSKNLFGAYLPYGRQDKRFKKGEANRARDLVRRWKKDYSKIWVIDYHSSEKWTKSLKKLSAVDLLKESAERDYEIDLYMSPDSGGEKRTGIKGANKERKSSWNVDIDMSNMTKELVKGKNIAVVDDLVSTGGTMCKAHEKLKNLGAKKVLAIETHGVLKEGINRIKNTFDGFYLSNTIDRDDANVDISPMITEALEQ